MAKTELELVIILNDSRQVFVGIRLLYRFPQLEQGNRRVHTEKRVQGGEDRCFEDRIIRIQLLVGNPKGIPSQHG